MSLADPIDPERLGAEWNTAFVEKQYGRALAIAARGYLVGDEADDPKLKSAFSNMLLLTLREVLERPLHENDVGHGRQLECSFCGRNQDQARLVAGANSAICEHCAETVHEVLTSKGAADN